MSLPSSGYRPAGNGLWRKVDRVCGRVAGERTCEMVPGHTGQCLTRDGLPLFLFPELHQPDYEPDVAGEETAGAAFARPSSVVFASLDSNGSPEDGPPAPVDALLELVDEGVSWPACAIVLGACLAFWTLVVAGVWWLL